MESMVSRFTPSRAEVVDISNAIITGIDAFILSPETAVSTFDIKNSVRSLNALIYYSQTWLSLDQAIRKMKKTATDCWVFMN